MLLPCDHNPQERYGIAYFSSPELALQAMNTAVVWHNGRRAVMRRARPKSANYDFILYSKPARYDCLPRPNPADTHLATSFLEKQDRKHRCSSESELWEPDSCLLSVWGKRGGGLTPNVFFTVFWRLRPANAKKYDFLHRAPTPDTPRVVPSSM